jgi:hypothetical protein
VAVSPEASGLCGCWQVIAVARESLDLSAPDDPATSDSGYYATSLTVDQGDEASLLKIVANQPWTQGSGLSVAGASSSSPGHCRQTGIKSTACRREHLPGLSKRSRCIFTELDSR